MRIIEPISCLTLALTLAHSNDVVASPPEPVPTAAPVVEQPAPAPVVEQPAPAPAAAPTPAPTPVPPPTARPNRGVGLMIAGFSLFGLTYLITAASATIVLDHGDPDVARPMFIPVAGPFIAASRLDTAVGGFALGFTGVIQIAGLGMGIAGAGLFGKSRADSRRVAMGPQGVMLRF